MSAKTRFPFRLTHTTCYQALFFFEGPDFENGFAQDPVEIFFGEGEFVSDEVERFLVAGCFENVREVGSPHQALRTVGIVDLFDDVVGVAKRVRRFGAGVDVGDFDIDVGVFGPVEQVGENGFGIGFVYDGAADVIDNDFDLGVASYDGFDGGVVFAFAKEIEAEVEVAGAFPERVLVWGGEVGVTVTREMNADAAKTLFGGEAFELISCVGGGGIDQGLSGEFVGVFLDAVGHVAVVEEVMNGLYDDGFFDT